ncbi:MAG: hypothetical protein MUF72_13465 [Elainella sp. Prado103]|nr:hypothetical protein [Elainella sp. Prado103]
MSSPRLDRSMKITRIALPALVTGCLVAGSPISAEAASHYYPRPYRSSAADYDACAAGLLATGLSDEDAAAACGGALYPQSLSACVMAIDAETEITAADALAGCRRVRRPEELASCVVGINGIKTEGTATLDVLDFCRRSLLPVRFSNCVVGLATQIPAYTTTEMMTNCIAATRRPRQVLPSFIPQGEEIPLQELPGGEEGTSQSIPFDPRLDETPANPAPNTPPRSVPALW